MQTFKNNRILAKWVGAVQGSSFANLRPCLPSMLSLLIVQIIVTPLTALFCLSTSWPSLRHFNDAVCVPLLMNSVQWSLFILPSARFHPLFTCLGVLSPFCTATRLSFPCLCVVTADLGSLRVLLWEPCVGKRHCFRPRRAWLRRDLRRSLGRHPLNVVSGPLRASVYCVLLKH